MSVENLVFNKLGNSFSVMISSEKENIQLWDSVKINQGIELFAISTIPVKYNDKDIYFSCILKNRQIFCGIYFYKGENVSFFISENLDGSFSIKKIDFDFEHVNDFFQLKKENTELIFKLSMKNTQFLKIKNENILIPKENFFKAILELF